MQAFTDHYYNTFDTNRPALAGLYQEQSMLTFEGQKFAGQGAITQKLTSLPFQQCQHRVVSLDAQPSVSQGVNIFVTGQLIVSRWMLARWYRRLLMFDPGLGGDRQDLVQRYHV